jgi:predicted kinase
MEHRLPVTLVVISGLPGTGKSAVAAALAARLGAVGLSVDPIEDALLGAGLPPSWEVGVAAYEAARVMAEQNLALGRSVVVDAVNDSEPARDTWRTAASRTGARLVFVVLTLPDATEHRRRLENRERGLARVPEPSWAQVRARAEALEPWGDDAWQVDAGAPVEAIVAEIEERLSGRRSPAASAPRAPRPAASGAPAGRTASPGRGRRRAR